MIDVRVFTLQDVRREGNFIKALKDVNLVSDSKSFKVSLFSVCGSETNLAQEGKKKGGDHHLLRCCAPFV